jgi:hypothetical protein
MLFIWGTPELSARKILWTPSSTTTSMASRASQHCLLKTKLSSLQVRCFRSVCRLAQQDLAGAIAAQTNCAFLPWLNPTEFPEVISVEPSRSYTTMTTRSWDFLGLNYQMPNELLHRSNYGEDIIIGVIDTG